MEDPSLTFGLSSLLNDDNGDLDLDALEAEITGTSATPDTEINFQSELNKLDVGDVDDTNNDQTQFKYPSKSLFNSPPERKKILKPNLAELLADTDGDSSNGSLRSEGEITWKDKYMQSKTIDHKKNQIVNRVLGDIDEVKGFDLQKENEEDEKAALLEEIDVLVEILNEEEIDISRVEIPTQSSSLDDIMKIRHCLRIKNSRNRNRTFAEESFLAVSHGLEFMFDGKKTYFGRRPDLTGWSDTVNIKLRRMRYDTSSFVSGIMKQYNLGSGSRIALELIPSLFLYSRMKKKNHGDDVYTNSQINLAMDKIRNIEEGECDE